MENDISAAAPHVRLKDNEFRMLGDFIHQHYGIKMPPAKRTMLEARLQKRLRMLGMKNFTEYGHYLFSPEGQRNELVHMVDLVTTNKTDFFREPQHFDYLVNNAVPEMTSLYGAGTGRALNLWSAGCSTGEEPYTLAMVMSEYAERFRGKFFFQILGSDLSSRVLEAAATAVYDEARIAPVPAAMRKKYILRSRDRDKGLVRMTPEIRALVRFRRINFMEEDFGMREKMDIIFCRNVIIYFDRPTQETLITRLANHLLEGGFLFMGHSETLSGLNLPLRAVAPTVYRKVQR